MADPIPKVAIAPSQWGFRLKAGFTCTLLLIINLLNYIDRYTMAPLLNDIKAYYDVSYAAVGILPTIFICVYMIFAPIFGRLGDRYSRKVLLSIGVAIWSIAVIACTFIPDNAYWAFVLLRGVVGIGEASYATIAPTLIADFFVGDARSRMLTVFYFAIPVGAGLGNVIGPALASALGSWQWGLRVSPIVGLVTALLFLFTYDPPRGLAEDFGKDDMPEGLTHFQALKYDLIEILKIKTYIFTTLGFAAVTFSIGATSWWGPTYLLRAQKMKDVPFTETQAGFVFGLITALGGLIGTLIGSVAAQLWRRKDRRADCLVLALSLLGGCAFLFVGLTIAQFSTVPAYVVIFIAVLFLCCNWAVNPDILLMVVVPRRRALATGLQTMVSHILGDAASPYIVGQTAEALHGKDFSDGGYFFAFRDAFDIPVFVCIIGAVFYFIASFYVVDDLKKMMQHSVPPINTVKGKDNFALDEYVNSDHHQVKF